MLQTTPFLLFDGTCADAMTFYKKCFGGELTLTKTGDTPMKVQFSPDKFDKIINAHLKSSAIELSGADWHADNVSPVKGNTLSIFLTSENLNDLEAAFNMLSEGADRDPRTFIALHEMPFGSYGQFTDKFGVPWIFRAAKGK